MFRKTKYTARICGHETTAKGDVTAFDQTITTEMPVTDGGVDYCLGCIGTMAIRCAICGKPIFIGDPVKLFAYQYTTKQPPDYAVMVDERWIVGCLRSTCCSTIAERAGFWIPDTITNKGHVERARSPFTEAMATGMGTISDVTRP